MRTIRSSIAVAAVLAAGALVSGCSDEPPTRAGTIEAEKSQDSGDDEPDSNSEQTEEPVTDDAAGRELTVKQARAALPTVASLPSGWSGDPENTLFGEDEDDDSDDTTRPAHCEEIFDAIDADEEEPAAKASASFTQGGFGPWFGVEVSSFPDEVDEDVFGEVLVALGKCSRFSVDAHDGEPATNYQVSPLSMANVGEETAAFRMNVDADGIALTMDFVILRNGHNTITAATAGIGPGMPAAVMEKQLRLTMNRLADEQ
ncbi:hypothetical protein CFI00_10490 [Nocardioides sp. S5]|uniref:hypothetical protein n=1 Tax=Nocardioides sp. S5 TaxID=2017486 RepID=UPI001A8FCE76|nr:hypothetical protein [Nocardioides sp. S5]QSR30915.1 hypothetical protein CFI00_10490 [Nocardioides sp. S5]